jgi:dual specificity phosphatase 12
LTFVLVSWFNRLWALRRSDSLTERNITHVLSVVGFDPADLKNFKDEAWSEYGKELQHIIIDVDDVEDSDLLVELPRAMKFIDSALGPPPDETRLPRTPSDGSGGVSLEDGVAQLDLKEQAGQPRRGGVFVHCAAGKSRSSTVVMAYLLRRYPERFVPKLPARSPSQARQHDWNRARKETANEAVKAALEHVRRTRPMAEPNDGFMEQLLLWWSMGCPDDVEQEPMYQRWAYKREVEMDVAAGQAPSRLRLEDEEVRPADESGLSLRCKKCRRTLVTAPFIVEHNPVDAVAVTASSSSHDKNYDNNNNSASTTASPCQHHFIEPLSWMRDELGKAQLNGRLQCPNPRCGAGVGRYDWKGFKCTCGGWVTPAFSLQKGRVDEVMKRDVGGSGGRGGGGGGGGGEGGAGIRMPPGMGRGGNL